MAEILQFPRPVTQIGRDLGASLDRMVRIQAEACPPHWTEEEKLSYARQVLFGAGEGPGAA